MSLIP